MATARTKPTARRALDRFRFEYGAEPLQLLCVVASLLIAGYALLRIFAIPGTGSILLWLAAAIVAHDLIALPLYSLLGRVAELGASATLRPRRRMLLTLNHVRIPAVLSAILLLVFFPLIFRVDAERYELTTGLDPDVYLSRWLLISAALFAGSALLYALRLRRAGRDPDRERVGSATEPPAGGERSDGRASIGLVGLYGSALLAGGLVLVWVAISVVAGLVESGFG